MVASPCCETLPKTEFHDPLHIFDFLKARANLIPDLIQTPHKTPTSTIPFTILTGSPDVESFQNTDLKYYTHLYLNFGEKIFDASAAYMGSTDYFKRR